MILLFLTVAFVIAAIIFPKFMPEFEDEDTHEKKTPMWVRGVQASFAILAIVCTVSTSIYWIKADEVGHFKRIYWGSEMPAGRIIAMPSEKGPQARIAMPGFHFELFVKVSHDIETFEVVEIAQGKYGFLTSKDGRPLREGQYLADGWGDNELDLMQHALYFMGETDGEYKGPRGQMGPQLTVLRPGKYRLNRYLWKVEEGEATDIATGFVGVIKSNVGKVYTGAPILPSGVTETDLSVPIVPKGYRGVWDDTLKPGRFYINQIAYNVTTVDTRVQTWKYIGGYTRRWIDLKIGDNGEIEQSERTDEVPYDPEKYADRATVLRVEGWDVFQDSRVQVQVTPENAPFVVAAVGSIKAVEDKIITPNYRSIIRNVVAQDITLTEQVLDKDGDPVYNLAIDKDGNEIPDSKGEPKMQTITRGRKVLDLLYHRAAIEKEVADQLVPEGAKAGLTVQWVRFGDPAVPPELLIPGKREQLAKSLMKTYQQEKLSQVERVQTEKERARANKQGDLMESEIGIKVATNNAEARRKEGLGEKAYMEALAKGQKAQADVLGEQKTFELAYIKAILEAAAENPDIVKFPTTLVSGGGNNDITGAAAILGASNITMGLRNTNAPAATK